MQGSPDFRSKPSPSLGQLQAQDQSPAQYAFQAHKQNSFKPNFQRDYSTSGLTDLLLRPKQLRQQHSPAAAALQRCSSSSGAAVHLSDDIATTQDWWCSPENTRDFGKNSVSGDGFRQQI
ncbi:hypothetical protein Droror1_Dr00009083 [Drosera rotundifolia]